MSKKDTGMSAEPAENADLLEEKIRKTNKLIEQRQYDSALEIVRLLFGARRALIDDIPESKKQTNYPIIKSCLEQIAQSRASYFMPSELENYYTTLNSVVKPELPQPALVTKKPEQTLEKKVEASPAMPQVPRLNLGKDCYNFLLQQGFESNSPGQYIHHNFLFELDVSFSERADAVKIGMPVRQDFFSQAKASELYNLIEKAFGWQIVKLVSRDEHTNQPVDSICIDPVLFDLFLHTRSATDIAFDVDEQHFKKFEEGLVYFLNGAADLVQKNFNLPEAYSNFIRQQNFSPDILKIGADRHPASDDLLTVRISGDSLYRYSRFFNANGDDASLVILRLCDLLKQTFNLHTFRYVGGSSNYFPLDINRENFESFKKALPSFYQTLQGLHRHFGRFEKKELSSATKKKLLYEICTYLDMHTPEDKMQAAPVKELPKPEPKKIEITPLLYQTLFLSYGFQKSDAAQETTYRKDDLSLIVAEQGKCLKIPAENLVKMDKYFPEAKSKSEFRQALGSYFQNNFRNFSPQHTLGNVIKPGFLTLKVTPENSEGFPAAFKNFLEKVKEFSDLVNIYLCYNVGSYVNTTQADNLIKCLKS